MSSFDLAEQEAVVGWRESQLGYPWESHDSGGRGGESG